MSVAPRDAARHLANVLANLVVRLFPTRFHVSVDASRPIGRRNPLSSLRTDACEQSRQRPAPREEGVVDARGWLMPFCDKNAHDGLLLRMLCDKQSPLCYGAPCTYERLQPMVNGRRAGLRPCNVHFEGQHADVAAAPCHLSCRHAYADVFTIPSYPHLLRTTSITRA